MYRFINNFEKKLLKTKNNGYICQNLEMYLN